MSDEGRNPTEIVNINTASTELLSERLVGIGPVLAQRIVNYRAEHGAFGGIGALVAVPGIGPALLERNADRLRVELPAEMSDVAVDAPADEKDLAFQGRGEGEQVFGVEGGSAETMPTGERAVLAPVEGASVASEPEPRSTLRAEAPPQPGEPRTGTEKPAGERQQKGGSAWRSVLLVILGGLLGVLLTLALVVLWSGTLRFAPRRQVDALSENLRIIQANADLAWQRLDDADARADELEAEVRSLRTLGRRVDGLQDELALAQDDVDRLSGDLRSLRTEATRRLGDLDERMGQAEAGLKEFDTELGQVQETVQTMEMRVQRFDAFLRSLRELLATLDDTAEPAPQESGATGRTSTPEATPSMVPLPTPTVVR
jgi:competence ComEA-like helix-hairpin-helix protein